MAMKFRSAENAEEAAEEARKKWIQTRADSLLETSFHILLPDCISEAIGEQDISAMESISAAYKAADNELAGRLMLDIVREYWAKRALEKAESDFLKKEELDRKVAEADFYFSRNGDE